MLITEKPSVNFIPERLNTWGSISNLTGKRLKNVKQSAISDHLLQCNCTINFDHFDILAAESNKFKLLLRESLLIKRDKLILNRTIKSFPLELFDWDDSFVSIILLSHDCQVFLIYNSDLMYETELGYVLICQVKEREKYVVLKMLL